MTDEPKPPQPPPTGWETVRPVLTNTDGPDFAFPFGRKAPPPKEKPPRDDRDRRA